MIRRTDATAAACRISAILFVGKNERDIILNFAGGAQVNAQEDFDEVMTLLSPEFRVVASVAAFHPTPVIRESGEYREPDGRL